MLEGRDELEALGDGLHLVGGGAVADRVALAAVGALDRDDDAGAGDVLGHDGGLDLADGDGLAVDGDDGVGSGEPAEGSGAAGEHLLGRVGQDSLVWFWLCRVAGLGLIRGAYRHNLSIFQHDPDRCFRCSIVLPEQLQNTQIK